MKRILLLLACCFTFMAGQAADTYFSVIENGVKLWFRIWDPAYEYLYKSYDASVNEVEITYPRDGNQKYPSGIDLAFPETVEYGGKTYHVTYLGQIAADQLNSLSLPASIRKAGQYVLSTMDLKHFHTPENLTELGNQMLYLSQVEEVWLAPNVKRLESFCLYSFKIKHVHGFAQTHIEKIRHRVTLCKDDMVQDFAVLPPTLRIMETGAFADYVTHADKYLPVTTLDIPQTVEQFGRNYDVSQRVNVPHKIPFTIDSDAFGTQTTLEIFVPTDYSFAYKGATGTNWMGYSDKIREEVKLGSTGYTSYYLENENFKVPVGCTAYIITGITPSGNPTIPDQAQVTAFGAGKIIPKQTGFILQGAANSTIEYQANVTGTEESVTGNLLIGTATEREFSSAGDKYYVLANGDEGLGFYKQGTRNGASIKLAAHRAGLRLAEAIAPAKGFTIDFEAARKEAETTGIRDVRPTVQPREDVIYDLQGRRVTNPGRGIYIVNGKKVVRE